MGALEDALEIGAPLAALSTAVFPRDCSPFLRPRHGTPNPPHCGHEENQNEQIAHDGGGEANVARRVENP